MANLTRYTEEEKERALTVAAIHRGNVKRALGQLKREGLEIPQRTLYEWIQKNPQRYQSIVDHRVKTVEAEAIELVRDQLYSGLQSGALAQDLFHKQLEAGEVKDLSKALRDQTVVNGIYADKLLDLTDRKPTQRVEIDDLRSAEQVLAHSGLVVESSAVEMGDGSLP